ncbi:MAG: hypothetical protein ABIO43_11545 [Sphingomicrobium sp.]
MTMLEKFSLFTMASLVVAVSPAMAQPLTPVPVAGLGLLGLGAVAYVGRVIRRMR